MKGLLLGIVCTILLIAGGIGVGHTKEYTIFDALEEKGYMEGSWEKSKEKAKNGGKAKCEKYTRSTRREIFQTIENGNLYKANRLYNLLPECGIDNSDIENLLETTEKTREADRKAHEKYKKEVRCEYIRNHHASICDKISQAVESGDLYKAEQLYYVLLESEDYTLPECRGDNSGAKSLMEGIKKAKEAKRKAHEEFQKKLRIAELDKEVRSIPASLLEKNLGLYKRLLKLDTTNLKYKRKVAFYQAKILAAKKANIAAERAKLINTSDFRKALKIKYSSWTVNDWNTAKWNIKVKNNSTISWKDVVIKVAYYGPSGTKIYSSIFGHTEYIIVHPGKSVIIIFKDIMCPKQSVKARAWIDKAALCY